MKIESMLKCEELRYISNTKCSDSVWKGKLWGQISEGLKKSGKFHCSFVAPIEVTVILLSP